MKLMLAAVSALALAASPALAQGNGNGNGNRGGNPHAQHEDRGQERSDRRADRQEERADRRADRQEERADRGADRREEARDRRADRREDRADRASDRREEARDRRMDRVDNRLDRRADRRDNARDRRADRWDDRIDRRADWRDWDRDRDGGFFDTVLRGNRTGYIDGCPPGLARKNPPCVPPGQARQRGDWDRYDERFSRYSPRWWGLPYDSGNYFYEDGFLLRYDGNRVAGYIPLLGGALSLGNPWPTNYGYRSMPNYYSDYYGFGSNYRYADNVVYRLDPETAAITSIAALLTGNDFVVGQPMPRGYDVYNVPYSYRDRYYDTPDAYYRYNNGYVYQIDPTTMLVASAIELIL